MYKLWEIGLFLFTYINIFIIFYILSTCLLYFFLFIVSARKLHRESGLNEVEAYQDIMNSSFTPPLSIIVPAYNEEAGIIGSVLSLLSGVAYPMYEVIVVNDGSKDQTLSLVVDRFQMEIVKKKVIVKKNQIHTNPIKGIYHSKLYPNLYLIDKVNGGKADALNAGLNLSRFPYFVSLDGDTILERDAFLKIMKPVLEAKEDEMIIATGGSVGIANGCLIERGELKKENVVLSTKPLVIMQVIEYLRAFLMGRIGFSKHNLLLIVSGAFGVFRTDWVIEAGGYKRDTVGEDMELVVRLHRMIKEKQSKARIVYVPDPVCYTEAPESLRVLHRQRTRWHRGLFESLWIHRKMILNPQYKGIGLIAMPYFVFVELLGPVIELFGYIAVVIGFFMGKVNLEFACVLSILMLVYGSFLSMGAVLLEEWTLKRYTRVSDLTRLFLFALLESFWYRPIMAIWRFQGLLQAIQGKQHGWGEMVRKGVST